MMQSKRGQITVFIILGFIILFAVYISIVAEPMFQPPEAAFTGAQYYVQECLNSLILQSPRVSYSDHYLEQLDRQLLFSSQQYVENCLDKMAFENVEIIHGPVLDLEYAFNDVNAKLDYTLLVRSGTSSQQIGPFFNTVDVRAAFVFDMLSRFLELDSQQHFITLAEIGGVDVTVAGSANEGDRPVKISNLDLSDLAFTVVSGDSSVIVSVEDRLSGFSASVIYPIDESSVDICSVTNTISLDVQDADTLAFVDYSGVVTCGALSCPIPMEKVGVPRWCGNPRLVIASEGYNTVDVPVKDKVRVLLEK